MLHGNGYYGYHATAKRFDKVPPAPAQSDHIEDGEWELVTDNPSAAKVRRGVSMLDFRGDLRVVLGGRAPLKPGSTGKIHLQGNAEVFPSVLNLRWQKKAPA